jgi:uncharacterized SAM-binding protein YcdF (DUF218 family)
MIERIRRRKSLFAFVFLAVAFVLVGLFYQPILIGAGRYLSPEKMKKADIVILEGTELIREDAVRVGMGLITAGTAHGMVVVYQHSEDEKIFGRPLYFNLYLRKELEKLGLKRDQIIVLEVPKEHPITLTEARIVLSSLSQRGIKSAILVAEGFHTRRSLWAYRRMGLPFGIEIIPHPYFMRYQTENWWQQIYGTVEFFEEYLKFVYYLVRGYIPPKSLLFA